MSIYRKNLITNDWVIFAPKRGQRPRDFLSHFGNNIEILNQRPEYKPKCPFCKGNEKTDEKEIFRISHQNQWQVRVLENKYASVSRKELIITRFSNFQKEISGFGIHDVIIDSPKHNTTIALMNQQEVRMLVNAYLKRYKQIQKHPHVEHIVIFKNQGIKAGGSLEHPHSQIYGLPVIPFETKVRLREMDQYYDFNNSCLLCDIIANEIKEKKRIIYQNDYFISWVPYASLSPYHIWIVPRVHTTSFGLIDNKQLPAFADILKKVLYKLYIGLVNPDYNFIIQSLSKYDKENRYFHWYLSIIPQIKTKGGLEYSGGVFINPILPEQAALALKKVKTKNN